MAKFSYEVVNFSGIPYDKPETMRQGREAYVLQHLYLYLDNISESSSDFMFCKKIQKIVQNN